MKGAILVALLFRTLDAFRVFDTIFIQTQGANNTESVSILGYNQLLNRLNLGIGSAVSVLIFLCVVIIATVFVKGFGANLAQQRGEHAMNRVAPGEKSTCGSASRCSSCSTRCVPVAWIISLSLKPGCATSPTGDSSRRRSRSTTTRRSSTRSMFTVGAAQLDRHRADQHVHRGAARHHARRTRSRGSTSRASGCCSAAALAIAMFPQISVVSPLFDIWRRIGLYDTWLGLIIPYLTFTLPLAIWILSAFFREIPWALEQAAQADGATPFQAFRQVIAPLAAPGMFTAAILVFIFAWNDFLFAISLTSTNRARTAPAAIAFFWAPRSSSNRPDRSPPRRSSSRSRSDRRVALFQKRIVSGLTSGAVKG